MIWITAFADFPEARDLFARGFCLGLDAPGATLGQLVQGEDHKEADGGVDQQKAEKGPAGANDRDDNG